MIVHVILFRPRLDLSADDLDQLLLALTEAAARMPSIRSFRVGRRVKHGRPGYEQLMREDYAYAAIMEFNDLSGLTDYLAHPAHARLGQHFWDLSAAALAYDYETVDATRAADLIHGQTPLDR